MPHVLNRETLAQQVLPLLDVPQSHPEPATTAHEVRERLFGAKPPEAVIFTSNSMRKALQLYWAMWSEYNVHDWPEFADHLPFISEELTNAQSLIDYFDAHIFNGDGVVREPFIIGYLPDGIPCIMCPTDGETSGNDDPIQESRNKIDWVADIFEGRDVLYVSVDVVQEIRTSVHDDGTPEKLGKPMNRKGYKEAQNFGQLPEYLEEYKKLYYTSPDGEPLHDHHVTGLVVRRGEQVIEETIRLSVEVQEWVLDLIRICADMGGGGVFQQIIFAIEQKQAEIWLELQNEELRAHLEGQPRELWPWITLFHIQGVPAWRLPAIFEKLSTAAEQEAEDQESQLEIEWAFP